MARHNWNGCIGHKGGDLQPGCLAGRLVAGLSQSETNLSTGLKKDRQPHSWAGRPGAGTFQHTENGLYEKTKTTGRPTGCKTYVSKGGGAVTPDELDHRPLSRQRSVQCVEGTNTSIAVETKQRFLGTRQSISKQAKDGTPSTQSLPYIEMVTAAKASMNLEGSSLAKNKYHARNVLRCPGYIAATYAYASFKSHGVFVYWAACFGVLLLQCLSSFPSGLPIRNAHAIRPPY
eukprot:1161192-Pelagomonas_calceolata.AAC.13